jgi:antitoxin component YwqK of YwqJK toxin-antitoxin module
MKAFFFFLNLLLLIGVDSCQSKKLSLNQMLSQDKFEPIKAGDQLYQISVDFYDTASFYDSPYQRYMLDKSNKPDGKFVVYDDKGRVRRTLFYKNQMREGLDTWYYPDGTIMQEKEFAHDRYKAYKTFYPKRHLVDTELSDTTGFKRHYDEAGNLVFEKNYITGAYKEWYPNGKIRATGLECPGECFALVGPWNYYTESGELEKIVFYSGTADLNNWDSIYHYQGDRIISIDKKQ